MKESETRKYISFKNIMKTTTDTDLLPSFFYLHFQFINFMIENPVPGRNPSGDILQQRQTKVSILVYSTCCFSSSSSVILSNLTLKHVYNFSSYFSFTSS